MKSSLPPAAPPVIPTVVEGSLFFLPSFRAVGSDQPTPRREFDNLLSATLSLSFSVAAKPMSTPRSLTTRLILRSLFAVVFVAVLFFIPAGSLRYWQGWVFIAILFLPMPVTSIYFLKRDPQLVERRLRTEEKISEQKTIIRRAQ